MVTRVRNRGGYGANAPVTVLGRNVSTGIYTNIWSPYRDYCVDGTHPGPPFLSGGGLDLRTARYTHWPSKSKTYLNSLGRGYIGSFTTNYFGSNPEGTGGGPIHYSPVSVLPNHTADGATAWNRFKPGNPGKSLHFFDEDEEGNLKPSRQASINLGQAIIELRQIPNIPRFIRGMGFYKNLGRNYLNFEFGWKPFLNDLESAVKMAVEQHDRLTQLKRDNGRWVRRRGTLEDSKTESSVTQNETGYPTLTSVFYVNPSAPGSRTVTTTVSRRRWFSAKFRYWIPDIDAPDGRARILRKLWGLDPTPSLVWEVTPWSWLADWFTNIGDVLSNVSGNAAENLVAKYAFNMSSYVERVHVRGNITIVGGNSHSGPYPQNPVSFQAMRERTVKLRTAANPFGFGLTFDGLSDRQKLILAALAVARS